MKRIAVLVFLSLALLVTWAIFHLPVTSKSTSADVPPAVVGDVRAVPLQPPSDQGGVGSARSPIPVTDVQDSSGAAPSNAHAPEPSNVGDQASAPASKESQWELEFAGLTAAELKKAADSMERELQSMQFDAATERHDLGLYEIVPSGKIGSSDLKSRELVMYQTGPENELHRVALPEAEFPAIYTMKQKVEWLRTQTAIASAAVHK